MGCGGGDVAGRGRLQWPVVSVGSLSAGGAGKTPVVIALAELLREQGWACGCAVAGIWARGEAAWSGSIRTAQDAARRFGDEPVLMAQRLGVAGVGGGRAVCGGTRRAEADARMPVRRGRASAG